MNKPSADRLLGDPVPSSSSRRRRLPLGVLAAACLALGAAEQAAADDNCYWYNLQNTNAAANLNGVSGDYSGPAGVKITKFQIWRWNPATRTWTEETANWTQTTTSPKAGSLHQQITPNAANPPAAVAPGTWIKYVRCFNTNDVGFGKEDRRYVGNPNFVSAFKGSIGDSAVAYAAHVDSGAIFGGSSGQVIAQLGLTVPAETWAYLYQVNVDSGGPVTTFSLDNAGSLFGFSQLAGSHDGSLAFGYHSDDSFEEPPDGTPGPGVATFEALGSEGIDSLSWALDGQTALAAFAGLEQGMSSKILVAFSHDAPGQMASFNARLNGSGSTSNLLLLSPVSEPGGLLLCGLAIVALGAVRARRIERPGDPGTPQRGGPRARSA